MKFMNLTGEWQKPNVGPGAGGGGLFLGILGGCVPPGSSNQTKKCHFPHPFSDQTSKIHTRFHNWLCHHYLN